MDAKMAFHGQNASGTSPAGRAATGPSETTHMPGARFLAAALFAALAIGAAQAQDLPAAAAPMTPPAGSPVAINGRLHVCGTRLCNKFDKPIQLRGMSTHGLQWYRQCINDKSLDALAADWKADVLRVSMYVQEGGYVTDPAGYTNLVHAIVNKATARGLYVIVDWHMLDPGDPFYNLARAKTFFTKIAGLHKNNVNVLYEVANEPSGVTWYRIKSYHEQIVPVIRKQSPNAVILLGTRGWSSLGVSDGADERQIVNNPVKAKNVMYTFHFYAASHGARYYDALARASSKLPMFVTEFGTQKYTGDGSNDFVQAQKYIDLMAKRKISWVNWNYSDDYRSGAVFKGHTCPSGNFAGVSALKPAGLWVRTRIRSPDNF
jgi:endoglucanase